MPTSKPGLGVGRFAPAKINLYLRVTGLRENGYHELDSLVSFASVGDQIRVEPAHEISLQIEGPEAKSLQQGDTSQNLVLRAAKSLAEKYAVTRGAAITLSKMLPVSSGIGGGSADAAATIRALVALWKLETNKEDISALADLGLVLGADVPVCLSGQTSRMTGIGEILQKSPPLPVCHLVLVNPRITLNTPDVFAQLHQTGWKPQGMAQAMPTDMDFLSFVQWLKCQKNDLEAPACELVPIIRDILDTVNVLDGCRLSRMSGSGATCFGLFETSADAAKAASTLTAMSPDWWIQSGQLGEELPDLRQAYTG